MDAIEKKALNLANTIDSDANSVSFEGEINGERIYSAYLKKNGKPVERSIGLPYFVAIKGNNARLVTGNDGLEMLRKLIG
jgi:hypothetical protein